MVQQMPEFDAGRIAYRPRAARGRLAQAVILMASATDAEMLDPKPAGRSSCSIACSMPKSRASSSGGRSSPRCRCSRERIDRVLRSIKREELYDLRDPRVACR